jgi:hypothetical protein
MDILKAINDWIVGFFGVANFIDTIKSGELQCVSYL